MLKIVSNFHPSFFSQLCLLYLSFFSYWCITGFGWEKFLHQSGEGISMVVSGGLQSRWRQNSLKKIFYLSLTAQPIFKISRVFQARKMPWFRDETVDGQNSMKAFRYHFPHLCLYCHRNLVVVCSYLQMQVMSGKAWKWSAVFSLDLLLPPRKAESSGKGVADHSWSFTYDFTPITNHQWALILHW